MVSVILHMNKFKRKNIRGLQSHNQRERINRSNSDIDYSRASQNYDLTRAEKIDFEIYRRLHCGAKLFQN